MSHLITDTTRSSSGEVSLFADATSEGGADRALIYIAAEDPRVTESVRPNKAETNIRTGQVRLQWLMPFALSRRGETYRVWDPASKMMIESNRSLAVRPVVSELAELLGCGEDFVFELVTQLEKFPGGPQNATASDMLKKEQGGGKGTSRLGDEQEDALNAAVQDVCVARGMRIGTRKTNDEIRKVLKESEAFKLGDLPVTATIVSRCKTTEIETAIADAYERDHLNRVLGGSEEIQGCHSQVLLDCSTLQNEFEEVRVVDEFDNDLGVANTVWGVNGATRGVWTVLGFPGAQNGFLVGCAIRLGLIDKAPLLNEYGFVGAKWPFHGLPGELRHDHGAEFINAQVEGALKERDVMIGCIDRSPPRTPHHRGKSERFHRTAQQLFAEFLKSDIALKYRRPVKGKPEAIGITNSDLNKALVEWVVTQYHYRAHAGLGGDSPISRWEKMVLGKNGRPFSGIQRALDDTDELKWAFLWRETRTVNHIGIQYANRIYRSTVLNQLLATNSRSSGRKIEFRFNPYRMGKVYIKIPNEKGSATIFEVPWVKETERYFASRDREKAAEDPTLWEWEQLFKEYRAGNSAKPTSGLVEELHNAKEQAAANGRGCQGMAVVKVKARSRNAMRGFGANAVPTAQSGDTAVVVVRGPESNTPYTLNSRRPIDTTLNYLPCEGGASDY